MLRTFTQDRHLDSDLVDIIGRNLEVCWRLAVDYLLAKQSTETDAAV